MFSSFNDTTSTAIYTLSLHDALPIFFAELKVRTLAIRFRPRATRTINAARLVHFQKRARAANKPHLDRKSTRLNSSHSQNSYAVFCLKKKSIDDADHDANASVGLQDR